MESSIQIHPTCIRCGLCVKVCPLSSLHLEEGKKTVTWKGDCLFCGHCLAICPQNAISMIGPYEKVEPFSSPLPSPESVLRLQEGRRSHRHFLSKKVPDEIIEKLIASGVAAPTGENKQDISYLVMRDTIEEAEKKAHQFWRPLRFLLSLFDKKFHRLTFDKTFFLKKAPLVILIIGKKDIDGALSAANINMLCESYGLGLLHSGFFTIAANWYYPLRKLFIH